MSSDVTFGIAFIAGLLSFLSPCVLPLVPAYIGYMGGRMTHTLALQTNTAKSGSGKSIQRVNMLVHGLVFVAGFTVVFVSVGLATTAIFGLIGSTATLITDIISRVGGIIIVLFGLHFMGVLRGLFKQLRKGSLLSSPIFTLIFGVLVSALLLWGMIEAIVALPFIAALWLFLGLNGGFNTPHSFWNGLLDRVESVLYADTRREYAPTGNAGLGGTFLMGVVFSAGWTPCIGPIYGTILTVAANTGDVGYATPLLLAYSLGLGVPFILAGLLIGQAQRAIKRLQKHMHTIELVTGALLVVIGLLVATGQLTRLTNSLNATFADVSLRIEECGVGAFQGRLSLSQVSSCLNGNLHTIVLRQSSTVTLAANSKQEFVFPAIANQRVSIEFSRFKTDFLPLVRLIDAQNTILATSDMLTSVDGDTSLALENILMPTDGLYTVSVSNTTGLFRVKIVEAESTTSADTTTATSALAGVASLSDLASSVGPVEGLSEGNIAPDFTVTTIDGQSISLSALRGDVVLLNFWGTWCAPCKREMPELQDLYQRYGDVNFTVLGLAVRDSAEAVATFRDDNNITFPLALDENNSVTQAYAVPGQPTTFLLDENGVILRKFYSVTTAEELEPLVLNALEQ